MLGLEDSLPLLKEFGAGAVFLTEEHQVYVTENLAEAFSVSSSEYTFAGGGIIGRADPQALDLPTG